MILTSSQTFDWAVALLIELNESQSTLNPGSPEESCIPGLTPKNPTVLSALNQRRSIVQRTLSDRLVRLNMARNHTDYNISLSRLFDAKANILCAIYRVGQ